MGGGIVGDVGEGEMRGELEEMVAWRRGLTQEERERVDVRWRWRYCEETGMEVDAQSLAKVLFNGDLWINGERMVRWAYDYNPSCWRTLVETRRRMEAAKVRG